MISFVLGKGNSEIALPGYWRDRSIHHRWVRACHWCGRCLPQSPASCQLTLEAEGWVNQKGRKQAKISCKGRPSWNVSSDSIWFHSSYQIMVLLITKSWGFGSNYPWLLLWEWAATFLSVIGSGWPLGGLSTQVAYATMEASGCCINCHSAWLFLCLWTSSHDIWARPWSLMEPQELMLALKGKAKHVRICWGGHLSSQPPIREC